jgi:tetratricopeptide (TPR) repeat protein
MSMPDTETPPKDMPQGHRIKFLGREEELKWLHEAWKLARSGKPQMRILIAESGYGKTKVAQAFYNLLATEYDAENYWPDNLLQVGQDLRVMPDMREIRSGVPMPWFWWGLRFHNSEDRNAPGTRHPFFDCLGQDDFRAQEETLMDADERRQAYKRAGFSAFKAVIALTGATAISDVIQALSDSWDALDVRRQYRDHLEAAKFNKSRQIQIKAVLGIFGLLLDPTQGEKKSFPVVLLLDDAQWMDPVSLTILDKLWAVALERGFPLLVVATHWQREWHLGADEHLGLDTTHDQNIRASGFAAWVHTHTPLSQLTDLADPHGVAAPAGETEGGGNTRLRALGPLPEVKDLLLEEFQGLSDEQVTYLVRKASGNPRHINEIILFLKKWETWFTDEDFSKPLTADGFEDLTKEDMDLGKLERDRFNAVEKPLKRLLGTASVQGDQFLQDFAIEVGQELGANASEANRKTLVRVVNPYALAEQIDGLTLEFRSTTIREQAKKFLRSWAKAPAVATAVAAVTRSWLASGKLAGLPKLESQLLLLGAAVHTSKEVDDRSAQAFFLATAMQQIQQSGLLFYADEWVATWERLAPTSSNLSRIAFDSLLTVAYFLKDLERYEPLKALASCLRDHPSLVDVSPGDSSGDTLEPYDRLVAQGALATFEAELAAVEGDPIRQREHLESGVLVAREAVKRNGNKSRELLNLALCLENLGHWELQNGQPESALLCFQEALTLHDDNWATLTNAQAATKALLGMADCHYALGDIERSQELTAQVLQKRRDLLQLDRPSADSLRAYTTVLHRVARFYCRKHDWAHALTHFRTSLQISQGICEQFGEAPQRLRDVIGSLFWVGDMELNMNHTQSALEAYKQALGLSERISDPRYKSIALEKIADTHRQMGLIDKAVDGLRNSLGISEQMLAEKGRIAQTVRDNYLLNLKLGDFERERSLFLAAKNCFSKCLEITKDPLFGDSAARHREISALHFRMAEMQLSLGETSSSLDHFLQCLEIRKQIRSQLGDSARTLRDIYVALVNVASLQAKIGLSHSAAESFSQSINISQIVVDQFDSSQQALTDLMKSHWLYHAFLLRTNQTTDQSLFHARKAQELARLIEQHYGATPTTTSVLQSCATIFT